MSVVESRSGASASSGPAATGDPVERTRAWTGLWVVIAGDVVLTTAAIAGVVQVAGSDTAASSIVSILTSAFTAIGTMTTAYFGIRAATNTAQASLNSDGSGGGGNSNT